MTMNNSSRRIERATLEVDRTVNPDWISGAERTPTAGEEVFCTGGVATVVKVLGKTSDGSRLFYPRPGICRILYCNIHRAVLACH